MVRDYPFESNFLPRPGGRLHYLDEGPKDAPPVLMVHGNPTWSYYYRHLVLALRESHRVIVPDHLGCGLSDKPAEGEYPFTLEARIADLEALMEQLEPLRPVKLVVHDWGGMIGSGWATRHPERVERLVVLNTAAFHRPAGKAIPWQLKLVRETPFGGLLVRGFNAFARGAVRSCVTETTLDAETREAYLAPYGSWQDRLAVLRFVEDIPLKRSHPSYDTVTEVEARLPALLEKPMRIYWGMRDFVFDGDYLAEWERRFPRAEVHRFEAAGHYVLEDRREAIVAGVREFFGAGAPAVQEATS
ncbi:MAG: alpha/beta fold hydrolase [Deltaproteobacteria bacterium]|nr:alpha/beta fold hydrolase [Deltaproteobacteria bacterium]